MYVYDNEQYEIQKNKKKLLQEQFLEKMKSKKKVTDVSSQNNVTHIDLDSRLAAEKKRRKLVEKQNKKQLKKIEEQQLELKKARMKLQADKNATFELQNTLKQTNECLKKEAEELQKALGEIEVLKKQNSLLEKMWDKRKTNKKKKTTQTNTQLLAFVQSMKTEIRSLRKRLKTTSAVSQAEKNIKQTELVGQLNKKNVEYKNRLKKFNDTVTPEFLLELLEDELSKKEASSTFVKSSHKLKKIADKLKQLKMKIDVEQKERAKFKQSPLDEVEVNVPDEDIRVGYITKKETTWYFVDVYESSSEQNKNYEVGANRSGLKFAKEQPVKVKIVDEKAIVLRMYLEIPTRANQLKKVEKVESVKIIKEEKTNDYHYFGDYRALVIGSQRMNQYRERLNKHGLEVELHNPFEEHESRIKEKVDRADVVVVCTSHISHSVLDHLDLEMKKVELIEKDTEEKIAIRTRFSLVNLELIKAN